MNGPKPRPCQHVKPDGSPCRTRPLHGKDYCFFHDPESTSERAAARVAGGRARRKAAVPSDAADLPLASLGDVARMLAQTINDVRTGHLDAKLANAAFYGASVLLRP